MQRAHRQLGIGRVDQHADLDLGGGDGLDVDALLGQRLEHLCGDAGMAAHADADDRDLGHVGVELMTLDVADLRLGALAARPAPASQIGAAAR